jgi:hypothetical protein
MANKPFLIRHRDGREYELAGDKAGKDLYRDEYQPQGFAVVDPQPHTHERPDLSEQKKAKADGPAKHDTTHADADTGDGKP